MADRSTAYIPLLDGLRAISIGLVVLSHFGFGSLVPGIFGVTIFFFISGYLIAGQLQQERHRAGTVDLRRFYIRRALRLFPALAAMVAFCLFAHPFLSGTVTVGDTIAALGYSANFWEQAGGFVSGASGWHPFAILWSLAVEEHYYIVFPLLTLLLGGHRRLLAATIALLIVLVGAWRIELTELCDQGRLTCDNLRIEHGTDTRVDSILFGALLAVMLDPPGRSTTLRILRHPAVFPAGGVLLLAATTIRAAWFRDTIRFDLQGIGLFACVGGLLFDEKRRWLATALSQKPLLLLGRWSYSLYLWHWVVLSFAGATLPADWLLPLQRPGLPPAWWLASALPCLIAVSLILAAASYYGVERPMVELRRRFGSTAATDPAAGRAPPTLSTKPEDRLAGTA